MIIHEVNSEQRESFKRTAEPKKYHAQQIRPQSHSAEPPKGGTTYLFTLLLGCSVGSMSQISRYRKNSSSDWKRCGAGFDRQDATTQRSIHRLRRYSRIYATAGFCHERAQNYLSASLQGGSSRSKPDPYVQCLEYFSFRCPGSNK